MTAEHLALLRRKEFVGIVAVVGWACTLLLLLSGSTDDVVALFLFSAWVFSAAWVALDAHFRRSHPVWWTLFSLATGPFGVAIYYITRPPARATCLTCGANLADPYRPCLRCGSQSCCARVVARLRQVWTRLVQSLSPERLAEARTTAKHLAFACAAAFLLGMLVLSNTYQQGALENILSLGVLLAGAVYWVLLAWWVYLDATWRRMEAVPWALLILLTNVIGAATYLVIRYPDPHCCPQCGAGLSSGQKHCPYCGAVAEQTCPRCELAIRGDWVFCPACAARLPVRYSAEPATFTPRTLCVSGTVVDAIDASPVAGAQVKIDSRTQGRSTTTDSVGRFTISQLEPRPYVFLARAQGYVAQAKAYEPTASGTSRVHFSLYPVPDQSRTGESASPED